MERVLGGGVEYGLQVWSAEMLTGNAMGSAGGGGRWWLVVVHLAWAG